jgi:hypothetical protein
VSTTEKSPGQVAFEAYNASKGGLTYDGKPIPPWSSLSDAMGEAAKRGWEAAARAARSHSPVGFGVALDAMRHGACVAREGWNGKGMWIRIVGPSDPEQGRLPAYPQRAFIQMKDAQDNVVPWLASQTDMLADDWTVLS